MDKEMIDFYTQTLALYEKLLKEYGDLDKEKDKLYMEKPDKKYKNLKVSGYIWAHTEVSYHLAELGTEEGINVYLRAAVKNFDPNSLPNGARLSDTFYLCCLAGFLLNIKDRLRDEKYNMTYNEWQRKVNKEKEILAKTKANVVAEQSIKMINYEKTGPHDKPYLSVKEMETIMKKHESNLVNKYYVKKWNDDTPHTDIQTCMLKLLNTGIVNLCD